MDINMYLSLENRPNFYYRLYSTHLENLGYTLFQFHDYVTSDDISWLNNVDIKERYEAHLDALRIGNELGFKCAKETCVEGEDDDLLGALFTLCSLPYKSDAGLEVVKEEIKSIDDDAAIFYLLALKNGLNPKLNACLLELVEEEEPLVRAVAIEALGYRGDIDPKRVWPFFYDADENVKTAAMVAVMRLGYKDAVPAIEQAVLQSKEMFNEHCILPLLMLGSSKALNFIRLAMKSPDYLQPQYPIYLALAGNEQDLSLLLQALKVSETKLASIEALGIHGSFDGIRVLLEQLQDDDDEVKLASANSLQMITAANLFETIMMVEEEEPDIDVQEIVSNKEKAEKGDTRQVEVEQITTNYETWVNWLNQNGNKFAPGMRYRSGKPHSLFSLLDAIANPESFYPNRQLAYYELVIRSGEHIAFEPDWLLNKQITALKKWQDWWIQNKSKFTNPWMFNGV